MPAEHLSQRDDVPYPATSVPREVESREQTVCSYFARYSSSSSFLLYFRARATRHVFLPFSIVLFSFERSVPPTSRLFRTVRSVRTVQLTSRMTVESNSRMIVQQRDHLYLV